MGQYSSKGLYNKYDKNHKERNKVDYYATPPGETYNILKKTNINFNDKKILEPCAGGGHMIEDINKYCKEKNFNTKLIATDLHKHNTVTNIPILTGEEYDFLSDNYFNSEPDWIIMNPPFSTIEPFTIRALEVAKTGVIMIARLQFLEGKGRYETIFSNSQLKDVYVYIDRINCWKDGVKPSSSSAQAYAWFIFDKNYIGEEPKVHWINRI